MVEVNKSLSVLAAHIAVKAVIESNISTKTLTSTLLRSFVFDEIKFDIPADVPEKLLPELYFMLGGLIDPVCIALEGDTLKVVMIVASDYEFFFKSLIGTVSLCGSLVIRYIVDRPGFEEEIIRSAKSL